MFPNVGKKCKTAGMPADPTDGAGAVRRVPSRAEVLIGPSRLHTGQIASQAELDAATNADLLGGYLTATLAAAGADGRLTRTDLAECHEMGASAAEQGSSLAAVIDLYLSATWRLWADVNARAESATPATVGQVAAFLFRAADDAAEAVAAGYEAAQRQTVRREESLRREFVDDLLTGGGDPALLQERAPRFGFNLAATHVVAVARTHRLLIDGGPVQARVETYVLATFGGRDVVVATKAGLLICVLPVLDPDTARDLVRVLEESEPGPWQVAIGRPLAGQPLARAGDEQGLVVGEVAIDRRSCHPSLHRDRRQARPSRANGLVERLSSVDDLRPRLLLVFGAPGLPVAPSVLRTQGFLRNH